jgi:hypothetical protein
MDDFTLAEKQANLAALSEYCGGFKSWNYGVLQSSLGYTLRRMSDANARIQYEEAGQGVLGYSLAFDHVYLFKNKQNDLFLASFPYSEKSKIVSVLETAAKNFRVDGLHYLFLGDELNFISKKNEGFLLYVESDSIDKLPISQLALPV